MSQCEEGPAATSRRPETESDAAFRVRLFDETRGATFAGLEPAVADLLLRQQFAAQEAGYRATHPRAVYDIVECGGEPVGRIVTERADDAVTLVDIALLAGRRGRGLGTGLVAAVIAEAEAAGVPVRLSVAHGNTAAARLYRRLGFATVAADAVTAALERLPRGAAQAAPPPGRLTRAVEREPTTAAFGPPSTGA